MDSEFQKEIPCLYQSAFARRFDFAKPKDPTIAEKFNTYRFAEYKEQVIDLLMRVCTVSVETMRIIKEMP